MSNMAKKDCDQFLEALLKDAAKDFAMKFSQDSMEGETSEGIRSRTKSGDTSRPMIDPKSELQAVTQDDAIVPSTPLFEGDSPIFPSRFEDGNAVEPLSMPASLTLGDPPSRAVPLASRTEFAQFPELWTDRLTEPSMPAQSSASLSAANTSVETFTSLAHRDIGPPSELRERSAQSRLPRGNFSSRAESSRSPWLSNIVQFRNTHPYSLLNDNEIRLFEIVRTLIGHELNPPAIKISLRMRTVKLSAVQDQYAALSYVWGDATQTYAIDVVSDGSNGESVRGSLQVTLNLLHALQKAFEMHENNSHQQKQSGLYWADAICLNQTATDGPFLEEREKQVQMMHQIYNSASQVIIDLGPEDEYTAIAMEMIELLDRTYERESQKQERSKLRDFTRKNIFAIRSQQDYLKMEVPLPQDCRWTAWAKLFARPWFRRMWVIQEYVVPRSGVMVIGSFQIPLERLAQHLDYVARLGLAEEKRPHGQNYSKAERAAAIAASFNLELLHKWRNEYRKQSRTTLVSVVSMTHNFEMARQVDRMYALLGMCGLSGDPTLYVSYTESVEETYMRFNRYIIERHPDFGQMVLSAASAAPQTPSWSPDWSLALWNVSPAPLCFVRDRDRYLWREGIYQGHPLSMTAQHRTASEEYTFWAGGYYKSSFTFSEDGKRLLAHGAIADFAIRHVGPVFEGTRFGANIDQRMEEWQAADLKARAWLKGVWNTTEPSGQPNTLRRKCPTMRDLRRVYARTIIAATEEEYSMPEHQDYLDGAWSLVSRDRWWERTGQFAPLSPGVLDYLHTADLGSDGNHIDESIAWDAFFLHARSRTTLRRLCVTDSGALALCPRQTLEGDAVGLFLGANVPYVLRQKGTDYQLIGEAYVQDLMSGEGLLPGPERCKLTQFSIV